MKIIKSIAEFKKIRQNIKANSIGFVPTMGNLHGGHKSLIEHSVANNEITIVSVYVNPFQFDSAADSKSYPRTTREDCNSIIKFFLPIAQKCFIISPYKRVKRV